MLRIDLRRFTAVAALSAILMIALPGVSAAERAPTAAPAGIAALGGVDSWLSASGLWDWMAGLLVRGWHPAGASRGIAAAPVSTPPPPPAGGVPPPDDGWGIDPNG